MASQISGIIVYVTTPTKAEAKRIAMALLRERLVACATIVDHCHSLYRWKGKIEQAEESILLMKTVAKNWKKIERRVRELHSYECPCIVKIKIEGGAKKYVEWLKASIRQ